MSAPQAQYTQQPQQANVVVVQASPPSHMCWSVITCLCCCWPIGIAALIFSCKVNEEASRGALQAAQDASQTAKKLNIAGLVIGLILYVIIAIVLIVYFVVLAKTVKELTEEDFFSNYN